MAFFWTNFRFSAYKRASALWRCCQRVHFARNAEQLADEVLEMRSEIET